MNNVYTDYVKKPYYFRTLLGVLNSIYCIYGFHIHCVRKSHYVKDSTLISGTKKYIQVLKYGIKILPEIQKYVVIN